MPTGRIRSDPWADSRVINLILDEARTVAVVGISDRPSRHSFNVASSLIRGGYRVVGVNPRIEEVLGSICYPSLSAIPEQIDVVDVFRKPDALDGIVDEVIRLRIPFLWLQEGVVSIEVAQKALSAGIKVVMDRCMAKEIEQRRR